MAGFTVPVQKLFIIAHHKCLEAYHFLASMLACFFDSWWLQNNVNKLSAEAFVVHLILFYVPLTQSNKKKTLLMLKKKPKQDRSTYLQTREAIMAMVLIKIKTKLIRYTFSVIRF